MNLAGQLNHWSSKHHPKWLVILRVGLGLCLFIKGIQFIQYSTVIGQMISGSSLQNFTWLQTIIPWLHLFGGVMIIIGLFTRIATLVQIPILVGAIFFVHSGKGIFAGGTGLLFSVIILLLLVIFFIEGGGSLSLDHSIRKKNHQSNL